MATTEAEPTVDVRSGDPNEAGYRPFELGEFTFRRDDYFVYIEWPTGSHVMSADAFLKALQRDVAWDFFYGIVNFDGVIGTVNHYGTVDLFAGRYNDGYRKAELDHLENMPTPIIRETFKAMLDDWTNATFDPFASPDETGSAFGPKNGDNRKAITRHRVAAAVRAGTIWVNCFFVRDLRAPFGGYKDSGIGREGGSYSREFFTEAKAVVMQL